jgi:hypothetical protein
VLRVVAEFDDIEVVVGAADHVSLRSASHSSYVLERSNRQAASPRKVEMPRTKSTLTEE